MLGSDPLTSGLLGQSSTIRPPWQVSLEGEACAQLTSTNIFIHKN